MCAPTPLGSLAIGIVKLPEPDTLIAMGSDTSGSASRLHAELAPIRPRLNGSGTPFQVELDSPIATTAEAGPNRRDTVCVTVVPMSGVDVEASSGIWPLLPWQPVP